MSRGLNKVMLIGHLGKDPETKHFSNGGSNTSFSLATSDQWTDKEGNRQERTEWHNCVANDKLGEIIAQYCHKGSKLYLEGSVRTRKYEKNGEDRYITEIRVNEINMLDSKPAGERKPESSGSDYARGTGRDAQRQPAPQPAADTGFEDDDIPF